MLRLTPSPSSEVLIFLVKMFLTKKIGVSNSGDTSPLFMKFVHKKSFFPREAPPPKKTVSFGTIDPNLGVWGRVIPNFYKSLFFMEDLARFCRKFPVNVPNLQKVLGCVHKFGSIVPNKTFFLSFLRVGGTSLILYYSLMLMHIKSYLR